MSTSENFQCGSDFSFSCVCIHFLLFQSIVKLFCMNINTSREFLCSQKKGQKLAPGYGTKDHKSGAFFVVKASGAGGRGVKGIYVDIFSARLDVS